MTHRELWLSHRPQPHRRIYGPPSHEQLDVAERRIAIDEIDTFELDLEIAVDHRQRMRRPRRIEILPVETGLDVVHRRPGHVLVCRVVALLDLWRLQQMMAAAL